MSDLGEGGGRGCLIKGGACYIFSKSWPEMIIFLIHCL